MTNLWMGCVVGLSLVLAACGGPNAAGTVTASPTGPAGARWSETASPPGIDVPGAQWLKIGGAGGESANVQFAAVLRPTASGMFRLIVWLHGGDGLLLADVSAASRLSAGGFAVLVGCWKYTPESAVVYPVGSSPRVPCLQNFASAGDAVQALIDVGHQLPGMKNDTIGLFGVSAGGPEALQFAANRTDIRAVVVDSSPRGPSKVSAPVLMGGTADPQVSVQSQQEYEKALRDSGITVEAHYYEGGRHGVTEFGNFQEDAIKRMIDFYGRYLR